MARNSLIEHLNLESDVVVDTSVMNNASVMNMHAKCGSLWDAKIVFIDNMKRMR